MPDNIEVASPASTAAGAANGDANGGPVKGSSNLSLESATSALVAKAAAAQRAAESQTVTGKVAEEKPATADSIEPEEKAPVAEEATPTAEEAPPTENAEATAEAGDETEGDTEALSKSSLTEEQKQEINARIAKERRKRGDLERRNEELENRLKAVEGQIAAQQEQAQKQVPPPALNANDPLATVQDIPTLTNLKQQAKEAIRFAEGLLETPKIWRERQDPETNEVVRFAKVGNQEWTEDMVRDVRRHARITLEDHIPQREQFLSVRSQAQQKAFQEFPFLKDRSTNEYAQVQQVLRNNPWMQNYPNAEEIAALQVIGYNSHESAKATRAAAEKAKTEKPKIVTPPAKKPVTGAAQTAVSANGTPARSPSATGQARGLVAEQAKMAAKRGISAEEAQASLLRQERLRTAR